MFSPRFFLFCQRIFNLLDTEKSNIENNENKYNIIIKKGEIKLENISEIFSEKALFDIKNARKNIVKILIFIVMTMKIYINF